MTIQHSDQSSRVNRRAALASAGVGAAALGLSGLRSTAAQEASSANHPVVGAWIAEFDPEHTGALQIVTVFHADGSITESHPLAGLGVGIWQPTGERTGEQAIKYQNISDTPGQFIPGITTFIGTFTIDDADTLAWEGTVDLRGMDGAVIANFPASGSGDQRLTMESAMPPATTEATPTS